MSRARIRQIADSLRRQFGLHSPCVDVVRLLEHTLTRLGVVYDVRDAAHMGLDEAKAIPARDTILIREDVYEALIGGHLRPRFTIIHELGHLVLHQGLGLARAAAGRVHAYYEDSEWQADAFAGEFLMPVEHVRGLCRRAADVHRVFQVSMDAAITRMSVLRGERLVDW